MRLEGFEPPNGRSGGGCLRPGLATVSHSPQGARTRSLTRSKTEPPLAVTAPGTSCRRICRSSYLKVSASEPGRICTACLRIKSPPLICMSFRPEPNPGIEPGTSSIPRRRLAVEACQAESGDGVRTRSLRLTRTAPFHNGLARSLRPDSNRQPRPYKGLALAIGPRRRSSSSTFLTSTEKRGTMKPTPTTRRVASTL